MAARVTLDIGRRNAGQKKGQPLAVTSPKTNKPKEGAYMSYLIIILNVVALSCHYLIEVIEAVKMFKSH